MDITNGQKMQIINFIDCCNQMISGKYILAENKIAQILTSIRSSEIIFEEVSKNLIGFDFEEKYYKLEVKNKLNGSKFTMPEERSEIIAMVYNLLNYFDLQKLNFHGFIVENYADDSGKANYVLFGQEVLKPFRDAVTEIFDISADVKKSEITAIMNSDDRAFSTQEELLKEKIKQDEIKDMQDKVFFDDLSKQIEELINVVKMDSKIKPAKKDDMIFILEACIKSANKYKDIENVSALLVAFDVLALKVKTVKYRYEKIKDLILSYYTA